MSARSEPSQSSGRLWGTAGSQRPGPVALRFLELVGPESAVRGREYPGGVDVDFVFETSPILGLQRRLEQAGYENIRFQ